MPDLPTALPAQEMPLSRIPFSAQAEASLKALCAWMQIAAVVSFLSGIAKVVSAFTPRQDFGKLVEAALTFLIAVWVYQAGTAFRKVATTDAADQYHLMEGFSLLRRVFLLQSILVIVVLTLLLVALTVAALVLAAKGAAAR